MRLKHMSGGFVPYTTLWTSSGFASSGISARTASTRSRAGEFDLKGFIQVLQDIGYGGPWGVEVLSAELRKLPMDETFTRANNTTMAQFQ
jgi:hypothetical protein